QEARRPRPGRSSGKDPTWDMLELIDDLLCRKIDHFVDVSRFIVGAYKRLAVEHTDVVRVRHGNASGFSPVVVGSASPEADTRLSLIGLLHVEGDQLLPVLAQLAQCGRFLPVKIQSV